MEWFTTYIEYLQQAYTTGNLYHWDIVAILIVAGFSIFAPQAPALGTFEGFIYTKLPIFEHIIGLPECLLYSLFFSLGVYKWYQKPKRIWNTVSIIGIVLITLMSLLGTLASFGVIKQA
ncbi:MAG TPA: hypothetical protein P5519_12470 [Spirochaetia bacterium]|nr:hypothetical protein [Spirochaetia bacterium]